MLIGSPPKPAPEGQPFAFGVIADPHLAVTLPDREERLRTALACCADAECAFAVICGDVFENWDERCIHTLRRALQEEFGRAVGLVPGNHDVGNKPGLAGQITQEARMRWVDAFGGDRWSFDYAGRRYIGINNVLLGSGLPAEEEQNAWLEEQLTTGAVVFAHYPFFLQKPDEPRQEYWTVDEPARSRFLDTATRHGVAAVFTGHLHRDRRVVLDGRIHATTPATSFSCDPDPTLVGYRIVRASAQGLSDEMHRLPPGVYNPPQAG